jgi:replication factor C subunit 3/5
MYADIYRPKKITEIKHNPEAIARLISLSKISNESHIILRGFPGSGKKILTMLYLQEKFSSEDVFNINHFYMECKIPDKTDIITLQVIYTPYFYYLSLYKYATLDKAVLDVFITNIISYKTISSSHGDRNRNKHRIIIIDKADILSIEAQQSLRRTLETKISSCRFIFISGMSGHLIDAICSRCIIININLPTDRQMFTILKKVVGITSGELSNKGYNKIINYSNGNIKTALQKLQIYNETGLISIKNDINDSITNIITEITKKPLESNKSKNNIEKKATVIRGHINTIIKIWQPDINIINLIFQALIDLEIYYEYMVELSIISSKYDYKMKKGSKDFYYIEAYCLKLLLFFSDVMASF